MLDQAEEPEHAFTKGMHSYLLGAGTAGKILLELVDGVTSPTQVLLHLGQLKEIDHRM